jgi:hypothetical protein
MSEISAWVDGTLRWESCFGHGSAAVIHVRCTKCNKRYGLPDEAKGRRVRCKRCENIFVVSEDLNEWLDAMAYAARKWRDFPPPGQSEDDDDRPAMKGAANGAAEPAAPTPSDSGTNLMDGTGAGINPGAGTPSPGGAPGRDAATLSQAAARKLAAGEGIDPAGDIGHVAADQPAPAVDAAPAVHDDSQGVLGGMWAQFDEPAIASPSAGPPAASPPKTPPTKAAAAALENPATPRLDSSAAPSSAAPPRTAAAPPSSVPTRHAPASAADKPALSPAPADLLDEVLTAPLPWMPPPPELTPEPRAAPAIALPPGRAVTSPPLPPLTAPPLPPLAPLTAPINLPAAPIAPAVAPSISHPDSPPDSLRPVARLALLQAIYGTLLAAGLVLALWVLQARLAELQTGVGRLFILVLAALAAILWAAHLLASWQVYHTARKNRPPTDADRSA